MQRSHAARGRFAVFLGLTRDEHLLFNLCSQACLPRHLRNVVPYLVMSPRVQALVAESCVAPEIIEDGIAGLSPLGGAAAFLSRPCGGETQAVL